MIFKEPPSHGQTLTPIAQNPKGTGNKGASEVQSLVQVPELPTEGGSQCSKLKAMDMAARPRLLVTVANRPQYALRRGCRTQGLSHQDTG